MDWKNWIIVILVAFTAGWMLFDGTRALIVGDYVTPQSGEYAGQLGPWSNPVQAIGIEPRSTLMKSIFVLYGLIALAVAVCFAFGLAWSRLVTRGNDHRLYFGVVVFTDWYSYKPGCIDSAFDWKEITMPAHPQYRQNDS